MSFLGFRKRGSSRRRIRDKLFGRTSNYVGKEDASPSRSPPQPPSPWGFLFPKDFVRIDGNLKAVIVDENGLDVIYWRRFLDMENRGKIKNPGDHITRVTRGREAGGGEFKRESENGAMGEEIDEGFHLGSDGDIGDESIGEDFSFRMRKSESSPSVGEVRDYEYDRTRYHPSTRSSSSSSSALPPEAPRVTMNSYGAVGISDGQDQLVSSSPPPPSPPRNMGGPSPPLPLPPGNIAAATLAPAPSPAPVVPPPPLSSGKAAAPPPPPPPPPPPIPGRKGPGSPPPPPPSKSGPPFKPPINPKESTSLSGAENGGDQSKPKLKPLHWDKVNPDACHSMVWHRLEGGSFK